MRNWVLGAGMALVVAGTAAAADRGEVTPQAPATAMQQADRDGNGVVDHGEFHDRQVEIVYFLDVDKDGNLTATELGEIDTDRFVAADRDENGKLSVTEFTAARFKDFDDADTDEDEVLTVTEIDAAKAPKAPAKKK